MNKTEVEKCAESVNLLTTKVAALRNAVWISRELALKENEALYKYHLDDTEKLLAEKSNEYQLLLDKVDNGLKQKVKEMVESFHGKKLKDFSFWYSGTFE